MRRRDFLGLMVSNVLAASSLAARAQQGEKVRQIGVLMHTTPGELETQARIAALAQGLQEAGWVVGRNLRLETRWSGGDLLRLRKDAQELVALSPDVLVAGTGPTTLMLQQATRSIPIVMAQGVDALGSGFVKSMARPGGNTTGFTQFEYTLAAKWVELLREIGPDVKRVGVVRDTVQGGQAGVAQWAAIGVTASPMGLESYPVDLRMNVDTASTIAEFAREPNSGLIVAVGSIAQIQRDLIIKLAAEHRLPTIYPYRFFVEAGGLVSYGPNLVEGYRRVASYVDRILRGEKPGDLPVQAPTKYELVVNLKTAKALGQKVPPSLLARVDEVIE